ncbi:MAG: YitT family protein [Holdemanella sp.]|nr:YitT family protein [Holdemanella sp.]
MKNKILDTVFILLGNTIYALGITLFILPGNLLMGGTTGIGLVLNHYFNIPLSTFVLIFNICMFLLGAFILGKKFAMTTLLSTFYYPIILGVFERVFQNVSITNDILLNTFFGGLFIGVALGIVVRQGASTGGMDIPPLVLKKLFRIPVSYSVMVFDVIILLFQFRFSNITNLLYGIILIVLYSTILDKVLLIGTQKVELKIISKQPEKIQRGILEELDRGLTILHGKTGYLKIETDVIISVMNMRDVLRIERIIHDIDEEAFIIITQVNEVKGRGFSSEKIYLEEKQNPI